LLGEASPHFEKVVVSVEMPFIRKKTALGDYECALWSALAAQHSPGIKPTNITAKTQRTSPSRSA
jgi:hypothetical protein